MALVSVLAVLALTAPGASAAAGRIYYVTMPHSGGTTHAVMGVDADGSRARDLTPSFVAPEGLITALSGSRDGRLLAFIYVQPIDEAGRGPRQMWVQGTDGSSPHEVTMPTSYFTRARLSPDGTKIAFDDLQHIWVVNTDGSGARELPTPTGDQVIYPVWSPDGTQLAYLVQHHNPGGYSYRDLRVHRLADDADELVYTTGLASLWDWSTTGQLLIVLHNEPQQLAADGSSPGPTPVGGPPVYGQGVEGATWSPDGSKVAFDLYQPEVTSTYYINVANADGSARHRLTTQLSRQEGWPVWVPSVADATPPVVQCDRADGQWHATNVSIACTATDSGDGLANPSDASFTLSTSVPSGAEDSDAATNTHQVCDVSGNCTTAGPIAGNMIDRKSPTITLTTPADGARYSVSGTRRNPVIVSYSCGDDGAGVATCIGTQPNGAQLPTGGRNRGTHTFTVTSTDNVGNTSSVTHTYTVA